MGLLQWDSVNLNQRRKNYMKLASYPFFSVHSGASYTRAMGWLRSVGSIKLYVSFAEYRLFYRALLQKRPIIWSTLPTKATQYIHLHMHTCIWVYMYVCMYTRTYVYMYVYDFWECVPSTLAAGTRTAVLRR